MDQTSLEKSPAWFKFQQLFKKGFYKDSEEILTALKPKASSKTSLAVWNLHKGLVAYEMGRFTEAESYITELLAGINTGIDSYHNYNATIYLCMLFCRTGRADKALNILHTLVADTGIQKYPDLYGLVFNWLGNGHWLMGKLDTGLENHQKALKLRQKTRSAIEIAQTMNNIGIIYRVQGRLAKALALYNQALDMNIEHIKINSYLFTNRGIVYFELDQLNNAMRDHELALKLREKTGSKFIITDSIFNLIQTIVSFNDSTNIEKYLNKIPKPPYDSEGIQALKSMIDAVLYHSHGKLDKAIACWEKALSIKGLEFGYQILCYEGITEILLKQWRDGESQISQSKVFNQLSKWERLTKTENLTPSLVKNYIVRAKILKINYEMEESKTYLTQAILTASEMGLPLHKKLAEEELESLNQFVSKMDKIYNLDTSTQEIKQNLDETMNYIKNINQLRSQLADN